MENEFSTVGGNKSERRDRGRGGSRPFPRRYLEPLNPTDLADDDNRRDSTGARRYSRQSEETCVKTSAITSLQENDKENEFRRSSTSITATPSSSPSVGRRGGQGNGRDFRASFASFIPRTTWDRVRNARASAQTVSAPPPSPTNVMIPEKTPAAHRKDDGNYDETDDEDSEDGWVGDDSDDEDSDDYKSRTVVTVIGNHCVINVGAKMQHKLRCGKRSAAANKRCTLNDEGSDSETLRDEDKDIDENEEKLKRDNKDDDVTPNPDTSHDDDDDDAQVESGLPVSRWRRAIPKEVDEENDKV